MERLKNDIVFRVIDELEKEGKVKTLTEEQTAAIDSELAEKFTAIREECKIKERNSWIALCRTGRVYRMSRY
ncbi:MAG: hypothetical protein LBC68_13870 [Prevotellaceae bacterium]|jgi:hypothetical protein|nr:hypothetical protein [Prevotellaceae bacterium]